MDELFFCHIGASQAAGKSQLICACLKVQREFPEMEVHDDHVIFKSGDTSRKAFSTREGRTLLQAAMSLSAYSLAAQDLTISFVSANRFGTQKCFLHITMCYKVQGHHVPVRCCVYIYIHRLDLSEAGAQRAMQESWCESVR